MKILKQIKIDFKNYKHNLYNYRNKNKNKNKIYYKRLKFKQKNKLYLIYFYKINKILKYLRKKIRINQTINKTIYNKKFRI